MKILLVATLALLALVLTAGAPLAQPGNGCTTVVLHAVPGFETDCKTSLDCTTVQPTTRIDEPVGAYTVLMYLKNYDRVLGTQVAFDWPPSWSFGFGLWNCQVGQISAVVPSAPGPITGTISTAFNPIIGGALAPIGQMIFNALGPSGCLSIIESAYPFGNVVVNEMETTPLLDVNEGRVCVGADGWNTCDCRAATPAEAATWGKIKGTYSR